MGNEEIENSTRRRRIKNRAKRAPIKPSHAVIPNLFRDPQIIGNGNDEWEMGNGKWEMGNGEWGMDALGLVRLGSPERGAVRLRLTEGSGTMYADSCRGTPLKPSFERRWRGAPEDRVARRATISADKLSWKMTFSFKLES